MGEEIKAGEIRKSSATNGDTRTTSITNECSDRWHAMLTYTNASEKLTYTNADDMLTYTDAGDKLTNTDASDKLTYTNASDNLTYTDCMLNTMTRGTVSEYHVTMVGMVAYDEVLVEVVVVVVACP